MNIAHLLAHYALTEATAKVVKGLSHALVQLGHQVTVWTYGGGSDDTSAVRLAAFSKDRCSSFLPPRGLRCFLAEKTCEYDLIFLHGMFNPQVAMLAFMLKKLNTPYIAHPHGSYCSELLRHNRFVKIFYSPIEGFVLNKSVAVQIYANSHIRHLRQFGVKTPLLVVPAGFSCAEAKEVRTRRYHSSEERINLLCFGRIDAYAKGFGLLLKALGILRGNISHLPLLTFIGRESEDKYKLEEIAKRLGIKDNIQFNGPDYG